MIKYINLPTKLVRMKMRPGAKFLFGALVVLTRKGTTQTTVSNLYLGDAIKKTPSQISVLLKELKDRKFIYVGRELGRRQISLNTKALIAAGVMTELRKKK